ncbi:peptide deformylase [Candidatus Peregrinibacteria bacterium]|nr:peptide deformylase [Candidatus Peregrinibacteria bacterium]
MSTKALPLFTGSENKILRTKSKEVRVITKNIKKLLEKMHATVREEGGVGLAAPQVGENLRIIIAQISGTFLEMINPEILSFSEKCESGEEGCLSLPGIWGIVRRSSEITVQFLDLKGRQRILNLKGFNARVVQHEVDHINGVLFIDRAQNTSENRTGTAL